MIKFRLNSALVGTTAVPLFWNEPRNLCFPVITAYTATCFRGETKGAFLLFVFNKPGQTRRLHVNDGEGRGAR